MSQQTPELTEAANKLAPWSMSKAQLALNCPYAFNLQYVQRSKNKTKVSNAAGRIGIAVHAILERFLKGTDFQKSLKKAGVDAKLTSSEMNIMLSYKSNILEFKERIERYNARHQVHKMLVECEFAVDHNFEPTTYWAKNALFRGKMDLALQASDNMVVVIDHKTGTPYGDNAEILAKHETQRIFYAVGTPAVFPEMERVQLAFHYVKNGDIIWDARPFTVEDIHKHHAWVTNYLNKAAESADTKEVGAKDWYCNFCQYQHVCPHNQ